MYFLPAVHARVLNLSGCLEVQSPVRKTMSHLCSYFVLQEKAQCFQKALSSQADKSTQTELVGHDVSSCIKQYFFIMFVGLQTSVNWFASAIVVSMHGFGDSKVPSETWEDNYNCLPAHQCPVNFRLYEELRICINECGWYVLVLCNFFQYLFAYLLTVNEVIMFRIVICCLNKIWKLKDNGISTVLPSDVKILFPKKHLPEFLLECVLIICVLMQERSQWRFLNCRNIISPVLLTGNILSVCCVA